MKLYIATPVNGRKGTDINDKIVEAQHRIQILKQVLKDDPRFIGCVMVSTFDIHDVEDITEADAMGDCIAEVLTCDAIYLDHGWLQSRGCNLEYRAAKIYGLDIYEHDKL